MKLPFGQSSTQPLRDLVIAKRAVVPHVLNDHQFPRLVRRWRPVIRNRNKDSPDPLAIVTHGPSHNQRAGRCVLVRFIPVRPAKPGDEPCSIISVLGGLRGPTADRGGPTHGTPANDGGGEPDTCDRAHPTKHSG